MNKLDIVLLLKSSELTKQEIEDGILYDKKTYTEISDMLSMTYHKFHRVRKSSVVHYSRPTLFKPVDTPYVFNIVNALKDRGLKNLEIGEYFGITSDIAERLVCKAIRHRYAILHNLIYIPKSQQHKQVTENTHNPANVNTTICTYYDKETLEVCKSPVKNSKILCENHSDSIIFNECMFVLDSGQYCNKKKSVNRRGAPYCKEHFNICYKKAE